VTDGPLEINHVHFLVLPLIGKSRDFSAHVVFNTLIDVEMEQLTTVCNDITNCDENLVITLELTNLEVSSEYVA